MPVSFQLFQRNSHPFNEQHHLEKCRVHSAEGIARWYSSQQDILKIYHGLQTSKGKLDVFAKRVQVVRKSCGKEFSAFFS